MALADLRIPLNDLLAKVVLQSGVFPSSEVADRVSVYGSTIPSDLLKMYPESTSSMLYLEGSAADTLFFCRNVVARENEDGELEHLALEDAQRALWRLVCLTWLGRSSISGRHRREQIELYFNEFRLEQHEWEVLWEIDDLKLDQPLSIGNVDFVCFAGGLAQSWMELYGPHWHEVLVAPFLGHAFGRVIVKAGARNNAVARGAVAVDDALNILRVALLSQRFVLDEQCLQKRGTHHFERSLLDSTKGGAGMQRENDPFELDLRGIVFEGVEKRIAELSPVFTRITSSKVRDPLIRSILWLGSSVTKANKDDQLVDLCTSLESILSEQHDRLKAETIALRYLLLGYAINEPTYDVHPLHLFEIYGLRNSIVHGSARRIAGSEDVEALKLVAIESIDRLIQFVDGDVTLTRMSRVFERLSSVESLVRVQGLFANPHLLGLDSTSSILELADRWQSEAELRAHVATVGWTIHKTKQDSGSVTVTLKRKTWVTTGLDNATTEIIRTGRDHATANRDALAALSGLFELT